MTFDLSLVTIVSSSWLIVICVTVAAPAACAVCMFVLHLAVPGVQRKGLGFPTISCSLVHFINVCAVKLGIYWVC